MRVTWLWDWWDLSHETFPWAFSGFILNSRSEAFSCLRLFCFSSCPFPLLLFTAPFAVGQSTTGLWAYSAQSNICSNTSEKPCIKSLGQWCCARPYKGGKFWPVGRKQYTDRVHWLKPWQKQERLTFTGDQELKHTILDRWDCNVLLVKCQVKRAKAANVNVALL